MGGKSGLLFKLWIFSVLLIFISSALVISGPVFAQDDQEEFTLEEIVVTGSRIARNNNESTSPIVTVDADLFDQSATGAIETQLNKLPQFTPTGDVPQVDGQDIQPTALNTPGSSTIALRGIGANRTLTLINGRRGTPSNAMGSVDINTIPTAAIQYVEMISGGASSTYGADAMAGVVNFIMKDRFEGFEFDILGSMSEYWDNEEFTTSAVMGTNFDDDRGNIMMAFAYNNRKGALQGERPWFRENWRDPSINGTQFFGTATGLDLGTTNLPTADALNAAMELPGAFTTVPGGLVLYTLQGGNEVFSGYQNFLGQANGPQGVPAAVALGIVDGYNTKITTSGNLSSNNTRAYLIYPLERYNFYTQGNYEINDHIGVFGQAYFSRSNAKTIQEPGVLSGGWSASVDPSINRNSIPSEVLDVLDSREYPDAPVSLLALLPEGRVGNTDSLTFNMTGGIEGDIPGIDWTWEVFMSHGESETTSNMTGFYSLMRFREIIEAPDFGKGMVFKGNPEYGGFGSADATCTSGLNPFDWASVTQDCWDAVAAPVKSKQLMEQQIWEANAQGPIADLPMGEMRGAVGISYRQNDYYFLSDNVNTQGRSFNDQILGLYPAGESEGTIRAKEAYAELLVPVLKDLPLVKQLELSLGGRRSDYNTTGVSYTYKAELNWKALDFLRFRGGYNRAERAPNIGELYLARTSLFAAMYNGDTCSMDNRTTAWTASPESNPDGWQDVVSLCGQLMESGGDTNADNEYYGEDWAAIYNYAEANGGAVLPSMLVEGEDGNTLIENQPDGGMTYIWPVDVGNAALSPEIADTYTFGFVLDSWIDSIPALMDWRASLDFYSIKIKDAIGLQTGDVVMQQCTSSVFNTEMDYASPFCAGVLRNYETGGLANVERTYFNNGMFKTSGIDFSINWGMEAGPGRVTVSTLINYLLKMESTELFGANPLRDYVGTYGPSGNGLNGNSFEWQALTTVTYTMADWDVSLRWQHLDGLEDVNPTGNTPLPSYNMFDLLGNYRFKDNISFRFGITNVFNKAPALYGENPDASNGMTGGRFSTQLHDVVGRSFYMGTKIYF